MNHIKFVLVQKVTLDSKIRDLSHDFSTDRYESHCIFVVLVDPPKEYSDLKGP